MLSEIFRPAIAKGLAGFRCTTLLFEFPIRLKVGSAPACPQLLLLMAVSILCCSIWMSKLFFNPIEIARARLRVSCACAEKERRKKEKAITDLIIHLFRDSVTFLSG